MSSPQVVRFDPFRVPITSVFPAEVADGMYPPPYVDERACAYCSTQPACPWTPATCPVGPDDVELWEPEGDGDEEDTQADQEVAET